MGVPELWKLLGDGEITSLASLSADSFLSRGRPFRIAIDEAGWRFSNLTEQQVYAIQQASNEPAYRGIEKNTFYRLAKLLQKNLQPLFVFDGPGKPWKHGKVSGRVDWEKVKPMKELLEVLKIPYHTAPGEAEAECVRLQQEGVVDAVWSEDADALMFGAEILIRDFRESKKKGEVQGNGSKSNSKKSCDLVRVYRMEKIRETLGVDREGLVCFTVLNGGDYDKGLAGCSPKNALKAAKRGFGKSLCAFRTQQDLSVWRAQLADFFHSKVHIPFHFPRELAVKNYCHPKVSTPEQLHTLRALKNGWGVPFNEEKVRDFISSRFNLWTRSYMNWVGPILLVRSLVATTLNEKSNKHEVKLLRRRKKKDEITENETAAPSPADHEVKLTFLAKSVTSLDYAKLEDGHWLSKAGVPDDPEYRPECEILNCFLRHALPEEVFVPPSPVPKAKKRKAERNGPDDVREKPAKRKKTADKDDVDDDAPARPAKQANGRKQSDDGDERQPSKRAKAMKKSSRDSEGMTTVKPGRSKKKGTQDQAPFESRPTPTPRAVFKLPSSYESIAALEQDNISEYDFGSTDVTTLGDPDDSNFHSANDTHLPYVMDEENSAAMARINFEQMEIQREQAQLQLALAMSLRSSPPRMYSRQAGEVSRERATPKSVQPVTSSRSSFGDVIAASSRTGPSPIPKSSAGPEGLSQAEMRLARLAHFQAANSANKGITSTASKIAAVIRKGVEKSTVEKTGAMVIDLTDD